MNWGLASQGVRPTVAVVGRGRWPVVPWCSLPVAKLGPRGCGPFLGDIPSAPDGHDPVGENTALVPLLAATNLVLLATRLSSPQGIGPLTHSKTRASPRRKTQRRLRRAHGGLPR